MSTLTNSNTNNNHDSLKGNISSDNHETLKDKFKNTINNYSSIVIVLIIILLSIIIQVGYYIAWMLCDTYFFSDDKKNQI
jgi:hypothetical protein